MLRLLLLLVLWSLPTQAQAPAARPPTALKERAKAGKAGKAGKAAQKGDPRIRKGPDKAGGARRPQPNKDSRVGTLTTRTSPTRINRIKMLILQQQRYRLAAQEVRKDLAERPHDPNLHALLAMAWSYGGLYADSLPEFQFGMTSDIYEEEALGAHAEALCAVGSCAEAARLRLSSRLTETDDDKAFTALVEAGNDLRLARDWEGAWQALMQARAERPRSPLAMAGLAELAMDMGQLDEAEYWLWEHDRIGEQSFRGRLAHARLSILMGDHAQAEAHLDSLRRGRQRPPELAVLQAEFARRIGAPEEALAILTMPMWTWQDRPDMLAAQIMARADLSDELEILEQRCDHARDTYGQNLAVVDALLYAESKGRCR